MTFTECCDFQRACFASQSWPEVQARTGIDRRRLANMAAVLRRNGFWLPELKSFPRGAAEGDMTPAQRKRALELNRQLAEKRQREDRIEAEKKAAEKYRRPA